MSEEKSVSLAMPKASKILDWGNDRAAILQFKNDQQPSFWKFNQRGQLYLLSCALDQSQTDFLIMRYSFGNVSYCSQWKKNDLKPYYTLRESFIKLHVDSLRGESLCAGSGGGDCTGTAK
jgi:hypothetical protein